MKGSGNKQPPHTKNTHTSFPTWPPFLTAGKQQAPRQTHNPGSNKQKMPTSRYTLLVDNISTTTRSADIRYEMERAGKVIEVVRDPKARCAVVEFDRADDAEWAWRKMDGFKFDGRAWKVDWATDKDFDFFDKKWTEGGSKRRRDDSRSRSRSRSKSPRPGTPRDEERRPRSPSAAAAKHGSDGSDGEADRHRGRGGSRSPSPDGDRRDD